MQAGGDGFGWSVTAEHMTFQDPGVFIPSHICKVPGREDTAGSMKTCKGRLICVCVCAWAHSCVCVCARMA